MAPSYGQRLSVDAVLYLIHHVVLPPKLPQKDDYDPSHQESLLQVVVSALKSLLSGVEDWNMKAAVASGISTMENLHNTRDHNGNVSEQQLREMFSRIAFDTTNCSLPIEIKAQNAGLLVSRCDDTIVFESFELSPVNNAAMASMGRLIRTFPGSVSKLSIVTMQDQAFTESLCHTIAKMTTQAAPGTQPQVRKNGQNIDEDRDTTHPMMVTDWLKNYIAAIGEMASSTTSLSKNTREEILWDDSAHPWRRAPLWLLVRVTLQLLFRRWTNVGQTLDGLYKAFVAQLLCHILALAKDNWKTIGSEPLYFISAKILRRLRKLEKLEQLKLLRPQWVTGLRTSLIDAHALIKTHWIGLCTSPHANIDTTLLRNLQPAHDLNIDLPDLETFLDVVAARRQNTACTEFTPSAAYPFFPPNELPTISDSSGENKHFQLAAFEAWVEQHLQDWLSTHLRANDTCGHLGNLIRKYHSVASAAYAGLPHSLSGMYLSLLELWVACDVSACRLHPLLPKYSPELNLDECQCLILSLKSQMQRLGKVESYTRERHQAALKANPSIFRDFGGVRSFAVNYFDESLELQQLFVEIEQDAAEKKRRKCEELASLKRQYHDLMRRYNSAECETHEVITNQYHGYTESRHKINCSRCALKRSAENLTIEIYEWPLSSNKSKAKATVFELQTPQSFSDWRDTTMYLIANVLGCRDKLRNTPQFEYTLDRHHGLTHLLSSHYYRQRILPLSSVKPHTGTHRKYKSGILNVGEDSVCLSNALQYAYFDKSMGHYTGICENTEDLSNKCMYRMPSPQSKTLERFLYRPPSAPDGLAPNEVIASLSDCPTHFSIDEYKSFGVLSLGRNILYSNILAQIAIPTLDFSKAETQILLLQITGQVGVPDISGDPRRVSHRVLAQVSFSHAMLENLEIALLRASENWESWRASASFVTLARRILSLTLSLDVQKRSLRFLEKARRISKKWLDRLKCRAAASTDEKQRHGLFSSTTEVALMCTSTFDVENDFLDNVLGQDSAISTLLQCSIIIQENHGSVQSESQSVYNAMLQSWRHLLYRTFRKLREYLLQDNTGLNDAVHANWAAFRPAIGTSWNILCNKYQNWLFTKSGALTVHFDLLAGELLVGGLPLSRLPSEFMKHSMYLPLFQHSTLEVIPTDRPGMRFSARSLYRGYELHFGMRNTDMHVVALQDCCTLDLLPSRLFVERMPVAFVNQYIHWYHHERDEVILRPRADPWSTTDEHWRFIRKGSAWRLVNGANILISMASNTARALANIFRPLEDAQHIHTVWDSTTQRVMIRLPRLQLDFFYEHRDLQIQSHQYRGMVVDPDQTTGVLVGLTSKLVLKSASQLQDRLVLIPVPHGYRSGAVSYGIDSTQRHVSVSISKDQADMVYAYTLDTTLGRILDSGDMQRRLFLSLVHATTSHCLPDPLTGYTGTESALQILQSAAVRSFPFLTPENVDLLSQIAAISPSRTFYPRERMEMQHIKWTGTLPVLSQHSQLRTCATDIVIQAQRMKIFDPTKTPDISTWVSSNAHLDSRAAIRSSTFRVCEFGAEHFNSTKDTVYASRDVSQSERGGKAYIAAALLMRDQKALHTITFDLKEKLLRTQFLAATVQGYSMFFDYTILRYDSMWLANSSNKLNELWCDIHRAVREWTVNGNKFDIMAWLSTMAFDTSADMDVIQIFAAFYMLPVFASLRPPSSSLFDLSHGNTWKATEIRAIAQRFGKSFTDSEEARLPKTGSETNQQHIVRVRSLFLSRQNGALETFVAILEQQWPCAKPHHPTSPELYKFIKMSAAMRHVEANVQSWDRNRRFTEYLGQLSVMMAQQCVNPVSIPSNATITHSTSQRLQNKLKIFGYDDIFTAAPPVISRQSVARCPNSTLSPPYEPKLSIQKQPIFEDQRTVIPHLEKLCARLQSYAKSKCEKTYVDDLRGSFDSLRDRQLVNSVPQSAWSETKMQDIFNQHLDACVVYFEKLGLALAESIHSNGSLGDEAGLLIQHAPRISPTFWLRQLHCDRFDTLPGAWKSVIIEYGLAVTHLHRAQRLVAVSASPTDLMEELGHIGHSNWQPESFPEMLLLEAESGIMIRREQEFIASQMRNPKDGNNIALQLLMGGGKSTTIVPMLVACLTDRKRLVRVIVAKPQSKQMQQMLVAKLGYLLNRRVYHMPFSRTIRPNPSEASLIRKICEECISNRGVLIVQPEHILSFKLMAVESTLVGQGCSQSLLGTQEFFDSVSRDIVDESDENFSVKFELIYTMGSQRPIEFAPERWLIIQAIIGLIPRFAAQAKERLPQSLEIRGTTDGCFPRIRFLRDDAAHQVLTLIANHIVDFGIIGLPQPTSIRAAILQYITQQDLTVEETRAVESSRFWTPGTQSPLLLIRGLIAGGILHFAMGTKRWRVNFGLDPNRIPKTQLAVPFRSKDSPSPRSEFSHPDVVIVLSLLSYYYEGLTDDQLFHSLAHLQRSDQAAIQYDEWVATASSSLPTAFRQLSGVSITDRHQCVVEVFPSLRYSKKAIDYYLSFLVFPKAMKEFPQKLSASGWDIGATKKNPLTGFSGTNDTLHLLPLTVTHLDLPSQSHTNALVLKYLLQDENSVELLPPRSSASDAEHILSTIISMKPEVRVILDCGAAILEKSNEEVAEAWLKMSGTSVQAVIFFDDEDLSALDRAGRVEPLQTSPFAKQLDVCLVYLDEAHTRGTDLKLPRNYRAGVTLGPALTKDKLTQGCMRMRKLGFGQSIAFIVPEEVSTSIRKRICKGPKSPIEVSDVLCWSIGETWQDMKRNMPLWAVQGERFERNKNLLCGTATTLDQVQAFLEREALNLNCRYRPQHREGGHPDFAKEWEVTNLNIAKIMKRCQEFEAMGFTAATLNEEQERELAPEIEAEREVQRPPRLSPEVHRIHPSLQHLVLTGELWVDPQAFVPAFQALESTTAGQLFPLAQFPTDLLVTTDFMRTVKPPKRSFGASYISDAYQRPVQYVLSVPAAKDSKFIQRIVLISSFEANQLLATITKEAKVTLHLFSPRANAVYAPLDKLTLYNVGRKFTLDQVPHSFTMQLNLFAGSLYLRSFEEYIEVCDYLGLLRSRPKEGQEVSADGFINPPGGKWRLNCSPVPFLRSLLMKIRREGEGVEKTHLGKILSSVRLEEIDFKEES